MGAKLNHSAGLYRVKSGDAETNASKLLEALLLSNLDGRNRTVIDKRLKPPPDDCSSLRAFWQYCDIRQLRSAPFRNQFIRYDCGYARRTLRQGSNPIDSLYQFDYPPKRLMLDF